ncbi:MAG: HAD family hydrolase [Thermoanaerobaculia bacterium]|nr:HAD family hydrolase [Thermoanaerobaculia bacterium]MBP7813337.1 HAD family hydrolase [Thermoanaerobaculia bacterium]HPA95535.1 HAD family hydrolase [Thermoanaerobaculia bacterium]HRR14086.1 HAD family hydrolase [Thermoanaerobaculia bacterium]HRS34952.1 HAD family hydrolase [Thermoanaerobaculia bacterium]
MSELRALVFDLYGTLIHLQDTAFQKGITRLTAAPRKEWIAFLRDTLTVTPYPDREAFVDAIFDRFPPDDLATARERAHQLLAQELASVAVEPSVRSLLGFLRRRGFRLGLLTNSGSPFREPFADAGLDTLFDAVLFSCDLGAKKPAAAAYQAILERLGVAPEEALMIGDSLPNDVVAPAAAGLRSLFVGESRRHAAIGRLAELAWIGDFGATPPTSLLRIGQRVRLGDLTGVIVRIELLSDDLQGRYNLVAACDVAWDDGFSERVYVKRFRHPEATRIEEFVRSLLGEIGIDTNRVAVLEGAEPLLIARAVTGERLTTTVPDPDLAFEIGRHGASAYLLANADLRPRNAFLTHYGGRPLLTMVDYEYSLFDRALDLSDLPERYDPGKLMRRSEAELLARGSRRVVTRAAIQRTRRAFFDHRAVSTTTLAAFREGWREVHETAREASSRIDELLRSRLEIDPPLIVGTEAYRRAFLPLDIADLLARIATSPDSACDLCF